MATKSLHMVKPVSSCSLFSRPLKTRLAPQRMTLTKAQFQGDVEESIPERVVIPLPEGATDPSQEPVRAPAWFGFVENAERMNSRVAMIGIVGIVLVEGISGKGILEILGFSIGSGLGFEF